MKREDLSPKTIKFITEGYKRGMLTIIQGKYELFCQQVTCDELEENYKLDENKQLVTINDEDDEISDLPDCVKRLACMNYNTINDFSRTRNDIMSILIIFQYKICFPIWVDKLISNIKRNLYSK